MTAPATDTASGATGTFVVELTAFSGPLDLLLSLIRDEQLDVYDIPIARIAEQFLQRVHQMGLDEAADYLEMAAASSSCARDTKQINNAVANIESVCGRIVSPLLFSSSGPHLLYQAESMKHIGRKV